VTAWPSIVYTGAENANVYVGGNYVLGNGVAEVEGRLVVAGNATFSPTNSSLFLGTAVGSWILPSPGSDFLQVGGTTDVTRNSISLASEFGDQGGFAVSRDCTTGSIERFIPHSDGPPARTSASPLGSFTEYKDELPAVSSTLGAVPSTHSVTEGSRFGTPSTVFRVPTLTTSPAVFRVDASVLSTAIEFDIPATQAVVINVLNTGTVTVANPSLFDLSQVDHNNLSTQVDSPNVGHLAGNMLWNFPNAQPLALTGTAQFRGSVVMGSPESTTRIGPHTNGRLFVAGDLSFDGLTAQSGLELSQPSQEDQWIRVRQGAHPIHKAMVAKLSQFQTTQTSWHKLPLPHFLAQWELLQFAFWCWVQR